MQFLNGLCKDSFSSALIFVPTRWWQIQNLNQIQKFNRVFALVSTPNQNWLQVEPKHECQFAAHLQHFFWTAYNAAREKLAAVGIGERDTKRCLTQPVSRFLDEINSVKEGEAIALESFASQFLNSI